MKGVELDHARNLEVENVWSICIVDGILCATLSRDGLRKGETRELCRVFVALRSLEFLELPRMNRCEQLVRDLVDAATSGERG